MINKWSVEALDDTYHRCYCPTQNLRAHTTNLSTHTTNLSTYTFLYKIASKTRGISQLLSNWLLQLLFLFKDHDISKSTGWEKVYHDHVNFLLDWDQC